MNYVLTPTAVRKLRRAIAPTPGNTGAGGAPTTIHPDDFPPPFTVRWAQSENNGEGAWVIWLTGPAANPLVIVGRTKKAISDGITAAQTLPAGWFTMDDVDEDENQVWLSVGVAKPGQTAPDQVMISNRGRVDDTTRYWYSVQIARMKKDATTGARRVVQIVDSLVSFSSDAGSGTAVELDNISTDFNENGEVEILNWEDGTPASSTTIAQDINNPPSNPSALVERDPNGALKYKGLGTLAQLTGSYVTGEVTKTVVTNIEWNATNHTLDITKATVVIKDGTVKSWTEGQPQPIYTTPISDIINQTS